jgi:Protein of unknown function (DUF2569)
MTIEESIEPEREPLAIGGWLILVGIGVVLAPFARLWAGFVAYAPFAGPDFPWDAFDPASANYVPWLRTLITVEFVVQVAFLIASIALLVGFFARSWWFPRFYSILLISIVIYGLVDFWALETVLPSDPGDNAEKGRAFVDIGRSVIHACIWVPYMRFSQRVKDTFLL